MLYQPTIETLKSMRLLGMAKLLDKLQQQVEPTALSAHELVGLLVDAEASDREARRFQRLTSQAKLRLPQACIEDINYQARRNLPKDQLQALMTCQWIQKNHAVILTGPTGVGKTYLACALAQQACRQGLATRYVRLPRLFEQLRIAHADGSYQKQLSQLAKLPLLLLDDWGIGQLNKMERHDLLEIIEDRYQQRATLITSQLSIDLWHQYIGDDTIADAILDRLLHNAYKIQLDGESMRKQYSDLVIDQPK